MPNRLVPPIPGPASQRRGSPAVQLLPSGCGANKGPVGRRGPSQPRSLGARRAGCRGGGPLPNLSYSLLPAWPGGQPVVRQRQSPLTNSGPLVALLPGSCFGTPDTLAEQVWLWSPVTRRLCVHLSPSPCLSPRGRVIIVLPCGPH